MSYLYSDFSSEDRVSLLELEIIRLQDLCRKNFAAMDEMRKDSKKLQEVHTELKETTSDLAYSLASVQCPWWQSESLQETTKILASFAQKIQYILELPTFIDPIEQLEKNGRMENHRVTNNVLKNNRTTKSMSSSPFFVRTCGKCGKKFRKISSYEVHSRLLGHGCGKMRKRRTLKCKFCVDETFQSFLAFKIHLKNSHSFPDSSGDNNNPGYRQEQMIAEFLKRNHVRVWRFLKCQVCDTVCSSIPSLKNHQKYCRAVSQPSKSSSSTRTVTTAIPTSNIPVETNEELNSPRNLPPQLPPQLIDLSSRPHLLVTLHEDTSETSELDKHVLSSSRHHNNNSSYITSKNIPTSSSSSVPTSTADQPQNGCSSSSVQSSQCTTVPTVTSSNENLTTDPTTVLDIEPMTVAEAPVRLSSMHAFSINTTTVTSTSSNSVDTTVLLNSNGINNGATRTSQQSCAESEPSPSCSATPTGTTTATMMMTTSNSNSRTTFLPGSQDVSHNKISTTTTMCFLPSSSSSWEESDKDLPSPQSSQCPVSDTVNGVKSVVVSTQKFTCSHRNCSRSFLTRGKLFHHEKTHTEIGESRSFSCQLCSRVFKDKYRLKTHFFTHCSDNSQKLMYRCIECGVFHDSLKDLARHTETDHSESKLRGARYQCQSCSFCTNFRCKLDLHRKSSHQCRGTSNGSGRSKGGSSAGGGDSSRVGGYTVFRDSSVL